MMTAKERKERFRKANRKYYLANKELVHTRSREWSKNNPERDKEARRAASKRYNRAHPDKVRALALKWSRQNKDVINARHRKTYNALKERCRKHGITPNEFHSKLQAQNNKCTICLKDMIVPCVDHDHTTGKKRDLLCRYCNLVLGNARDSVFVLEQSIAYLKKHGTEFNAWAMIMPSDLIERSSPITMMGLTQ